MRNPLSKALWSIGLVVLGAGLVLLADAIHVHVGEKTAAILAIIGITLAVIFLFTFLWALFSAIGYARLMSGKDLIARWHVTAGDWDRFRAFDKSRAAEHPSLRNDMRIRKQTPPQGVDVIVGRGKIIVDDSYQNIAGRVSGGRQINWLNARSIPNASNFPSPIPAARAARWTLPCAYRCPPPHAPKVWAYSSTIDPRTRNSYCRLATIVRRLSILPRQKQQP